MGSWGDIASLARIAAGGKTTQRAERNAHRTSGNGGSDGGSAFAKALADAIRAAAQQRQSSDRASQIADAYRQSTLGAPYETTFGQTKKGKYSGFSTEGELKAAALGRGRERYANDQARAEKIRGQGHDLEKRTNTAYQDALDKMHTAVDQRVTADRPDVFLGPDGKIITPDEVKKLEAQSTAPAQEAIAKIMQAWGQPLDQSAVPAAAGAPQGGGATTNILGDQYAAYDPQAQAVVDQRKDAETRQANYPTSRVEVAPQAPQSESQLGISHGKDLTYEERAQRSDLGWGLDRAQARFAQLADQQAQTDATNSLYGPSYEGDLGKWRDESLGRAMTVQDLADQLASTPFNQYVQQGAADYGVDPYLASGWFGANLNAPELKANRDTQSIADTGLPYTEQQQAITAQQKADKQAQTDADAQALQAFQADAFDQLGLDGHQVAQAANMTDEQLAQYLQDPTFQSANQAVQDALGAAGEGDYQTLADLQQQLEFSDPGMYQIFQAAYGDQFKAALDALNNG